MTLDASLLASGGSNPDAASFTTPSVATTDGALLLVAVQGGLVSGTPPTPTSITGSLTLDTPLALLEDGITGNNNCRMSLYAGYADGSTGTLTFNFSTTMGNCSWKVVEVTGDTGTPTVVQSDIEVQTQNPALALTGVDTGNTLFGFLVYNAGAAQTVGYGGDFTSLGSAFVTSSPTGQIAAEYDATAPADGTADFTTTNAGSTVIAAVEVTETSSGTTYSASGTVAATSGTSLSAAIIRATAGTVAATSATSAAASRLTPASGTVAATSGTSLAATSTCAAAGTVAATSGAALTATSLRLASGQVDALTATSLTAARILPASGQVDATSGTSLDATITSGSTTYPASGTVAVVSGTSLAATRIRLAAGTVPAVSATSLTVTALLPTTGTCVATTGTSGSVSAILSASGVTAATSTAALAVTSLLTTAGTCPAATAASLAATIVPVDVTDPLGPVAGGPDAPHWAGSAAGSGWGGSANGDRWSGGPGFQDIGGGA